ncbi:MAG: type II/IV secretion system ATPase subunit [Candidatus Altiarchaeota archaeon]
MGLREKAELIRERGVLTEALGRHVRAYGAVVAVKASKKLKAGRRDFKRSLEKLEGDGRIKIVKRFLRPPAIKATDKLLLEMPPGVGKNNLLDLMESEGRLTTRDAAERLGLSYEVVREWASILQRDNLVVLDKGVIKAVMPRIFRHRLDGELAESSRGSRTIYTQVDYLYDSLKRAGRMSVPDAALLCETTPERIEKWAKHLDVFTIEYPSNLMKEAQVKLSKKQVNQEGEEELEGQVLDSYKLTADKVVAEVRIISSKKKSKPIYMVKVPKICAATHSMMDFMRDILSSRVKIEVGDISDSRKMMELKEKFFDEARRILMSELDLDTDDANVLAGTMTHYMYGLGDIELLMHDDWLEEVCVNTSHIPLTAYHKRFGWVETSLTIKDERSVYNYAAQIGRKVERDITNMEPIMDAHLLSGDRVNATLFPISNFGNTITIRKFARQPWTIAHFVSPETQSLSYEMAAFLWLAFQYELNVLVGGGTASGKTSMLNCLCSLIQPTHRVITIEDTRELNLPKYLKWNWVPLNTREANPEGKGEVSMLDLIVTSLRMRPDRIVLGEIRRRREAEVLFEAMHTGHSVYGTIHADTVHNLKRRLLEPPIELPAAEVEALHLMIVVYRDRRKGSRKVFEIAEIRPGTGSSEFELNYLYRYDTRSGEFLTMHDSVRIFDELSLHTGMTRPDIERDLGEKEAVLQWMVKENKKSLDDVGEVMDLYYKDKEGLLKMVRDSGVEVPKGKGGEGDVGDDAAVKKQGGEEKAAVKKEGVDRKRPPKKDESDDFKPPDMSQLG